MTDIHLDSSNRTNRASWVILLLLALHVAATFVFLPPWKVLNGQPLQSGDYPVHVHRVQVYRDGLATTGIPWGYDPAIGAGHVLEPKQDVGIKACQNVAVLLPFLNAGQVLQVFIFVTVLTNPLWILLTCRLLRIESTAQAWILLGLLVVTWLHPTFSGYLHWGLVCFVASGFFAPLCLALFLRFLDEPRLWRYLAFTASACLLFFLHVLGPLVLVPAMVLLTLTARGVSWGWKVSLCLVPLVVLLVNSFWVVPHLFAARMPIPPHPEWTVEVEPHLTVDNWSQLVSGVTPSWLLLRLVGLAVVICGFPTLVKVAGRRAAIAIGMTVAFAVALRFLGFTLEPLRVMQPSRFIFPGVVIMSIPAGLAAYRLATRIPIPTHLQAASLSLLVAVVAIWLDKPTQLELPPNPDPLGTFIAEHTTPEDRLMVQSSDGYRFSGFEASVFAVAYQREVIGNTFSDITDAAQFHRDILWGRPLSQWRSEDLKAALKRWGITWVFTRTDEGRTLLEAATGSPGVPVSKYQAFRTAASTSRFLIGKGQVSTRINKLELSELKPENGIIVLKYRYHPAWRTTSGQSVLRFSNQEDPIGFIALRDPDPEVTLVFDGILMFQACWKDDYDLPQP